MKITKFHTHRSVDRSDPGFTVPGLKLRWINGRVAENNPDRPWAVLRKSDLPADLVRHIESVNPYAFREGDTIRRGDLILGFATADAVALHREYLDEQAQEASQRVRHAPTVKDRHGGNRAKVETAELKDATTEMVARFKAQKEQE